MSTNAAIVLIVLIVCATVTNCVRVITSKRP